MPIFRVTITAGACESPAFHKEILVHCRRKEEVETKFAQIEASDMFDDLWPSESNTGCKIKVEEHTHVNPIDLGSALFSALNEMNHEKPHMAAEHILHGGDLDNFNEKNGLG